MMNIKKFNITIAVAVLVVLGSVAFIIKTINAPKKATDEVTPTIQEVLPTVDSSVQIDLSFADNKKSMILNIKNIPSQTDSIEYEISYMTGSGLPKGNIGTIRITNEKAVTRSGEELTLGTCSRGKCVYYEGITKVSLSLKFHKADGSSSIFQKDYSL